MKTAAQVGLNSSGYDFRGDRQEGTQTAAKNLTENIRKIGADLDSTAGTVRAFSNMTVSMQQMLDATADILKKAGQNTQTNLSLFNETGNSVDSLRGAVSVNAQKVSIRCWPREVSAMMPYLDRSTVHFLLFLQMLRQLQGH